MNGDALIQALDLPAGSRVDQRVPKKLLLETLREIEGEKDAVKLQMTANSIALMARSLSFDSDFMSPFAINARKNNINTIGELTTEKLLSGKVSSNFLVFQVENPMTSQSCWPQWRCEKRCRILQQQINFKIYEFAIVFFRVFFL